MTRRFDPLVHVAFALVACGVSIVIAVFTLWPGSPIDHLGGGAVYAEGGERRALSSDSGSATGPDANSRLSLDDTAEESAPPPTLAKEEDTTGTLHCTVVDERWAPVSNAEIWIDDSGSWRMAGRSDKWGRFDLEIAKDHWKQRIAEGQSIHIGARGVDHGPSLVSSFDKLPSADLQLVLRGHGASLQLEVSTPDGRPVPDAMVRFEDLVAPGQTATLAVMVAPGEHKRPTPPPSRSTNSFGVAIFEGLEFGTRTYTIEADGYRSKRGLVELVAGEPRVVHVQLTPVASLRGLALGVERRPLAGTTISVISEHEGQPITVSCNEEGFFELLDIPAGRLEIVAEARRDQTTTHDARGFIFLRAGQAGEWNPTLRPVAALSGRLTDHWGQPLVGWEVRLDNGDLDTPPREALTDDSGLYELKVPTNLFKSRLSFFHPHASGGIPTRQIELELREKQREIREVELDEDEENASSIRGRVINAAGRPTWDYPVVLQRLSDLSTLRVEPDEHTGLFQTPALPPGSYILRFPHLGMGWALDQRIVIDGRRPLDLGRVELPATGQLSLITSGSNRREACVQVHVELMRPEVDYDFGLPVLVGRIELPLQLSFAPGSYRFRLPGTADRRWFELNIESGETTHFQVPGTE